MKHITFTSKKHQYESDGVNYNSVSKLIARYKNKFKRDYWSKYKALEKVLSRNDFKSTLKLFRPGTDSCLFALESKLTAKQREKYPKVQQAILASWLSINKKSTRRGHKYHNRKEKESYKRGYETHPVLKKKFKTFKKEHISGGRNKSIITNLYELDSGFYPELLIWNDKNLLAGQADKIFIEETTKGKFVDVDDYKTNKKINISNNYGQKMKYPIEHLDDCNFIHYSLQLSAYAWMMEQFGFTVRNICFNHMDHNGKNTLYNVAYLKKEVEAMLKHR